MFSILRFVEKIFSVVFLVSTKENTIYDFQKGEEKYLNQINILKVFNKNYSRRLSENGDNPEKPREISHHFYFKRNKDIIRFAADVRQKEFTIIGKLPAGNNNSDIGYKIMRIDKTNTISISEFTNLLCRLAYKNNGLYKGWETVPVTKG